jgi:hypothetical protein
MLNKLQTIDRRILYVIVIFVIIIPLVTKPSTHPSVITPEVQNAFNVLDRLPINKVAFISTSWNAGTMGENGPQTDVIVRHLLKKDIKFVIVSFDVSGSELTYQIVEKASKDLGKTYGKDWVHLGYKVPQLQLILAGMAKDFQKVYSNDKFKTNLSKIEVTKNVKTYKDIGAVVDISAGSIGGVTTVDTWIAYFCGPRNVPLIFCPTAVMAAEAYPYLDSKQINGMLNGVIGAVQYETLIGRGKDRTDAAATALALSSAHIFIIALIVLGNLGYFLSRPKKVKK